MPLSRQHLILHTARTQGYTKVMMGDSCSRLAIKLLSNISLGRGASLATDTVRGKRPPLFQLSRIVNIMFMPL